MSKSLRYRVVGLPVLLGAGLAPLPALAEEPIDYVRVCDAFGARFYYIPGTDTCVRIGGVAAVGAGDSFSAAFASVYANVSSNSGFGVQVDAESAWRESANHAWSMTGSVFHRNPSMYHAALFVTRAEFPIFGDLMTEFGFDGALYMRRSTIQVSVGRQTFEFGDQFKQDISLLKFALNFTHYVTPNFKIGATFGHVSGFDSFAVGAEGRLGNVNGVSLRGFVTGTFVDTSDNQPSNTIFLIGLKIGGAGQSMMVEDRTGHIDLLQSVSHYAGLPPIKYKK